MYVDFNPERQATVGPRAAPDALPPVANVIDALFAKPVSVRCSRDRVRCELHPCEAMSLGDARPVRREEFETGRALARLALAEYGAAAPLPKGTGGAVSWPPGFTGSITHTKGFAAAAVCPVSTFKSIGLDAEVIASVEAGLAPHVLNTSELASWSAIPPGDRDLSLAVRFSAKEAFYKAQFPLTGRWLEFHDVTVQVGPGWFLARSERGHAPDSLRELQGRWAAIQDHVLAAVAIP